jgi:hypothetical protein
MIKMSKPFTLKIFVADGDPEGIRIVETMNWTGRGIVFPRTKWLDASKRNEFDGAGVYILTGYGETQDADDEDQPTAYIGQTDNLRSRIGDHFSKKAFWDKACVFLSTNQALNRAHFTWLEWELIKKAADAGRCKLDNGNEPSEPKLSESEKADTRSFFNEILQFLPIMGVPIFEKKVASIARASTTTRSEQSTSCLSTDTRDTVIVPAQEEGFQSVFLGQDCWYAIRISGAMLNDIKWIAAYQTKPVSAVTHLAEVDSIEEYGDSGKYKLIFKSKAEELDKQIPLGSAPQGAIQSPRYTTRAKLLSAKDLAEALS